MPHGHKSKRHACQKRPQAKGDMRGVEVAQEARTLRAKALAGEVEASAIAAVRAAIPTAATAAPQKAAARAAVKAGAAKAAAAAAAKTAAKAAPPAAVKAAAKAAAPASASEAAGKPVASAAVTAGAAKVAAAAAGKPAAKVVAPAAVKEAAAKAAALAAGKGATKAAATSVAKAATAAVAAAGRNEPEKGKESSLTRGPADASPCRPPLTPPRRSPSPGALSSGHSVNADSVSSCDREELFSLASLSTDCFSDDPDYHIETLEWCILQKFHLRQPFTRQDLVQSISLPYRYQFPGIFKKVCDHVEAVFAVEVREVDSTRHSYNLFSILSLPNNGRIRPGRGYPKTGLLIKILAVILIKDHCAAEEDIWKFLKRIQVYPGKKHNIFGEPKRLLTQDFVRLKYLEYRQVPGSVPPRHEFLWGPKANAETTKEKIMKFLTRINKNSPTYFSSLYEDFGRDVVVKLQTVLSAKPIPVIITRPITSATYYATGFQPFDI
ncbi:melanoma-associated antigen B3-like [Cavia porcellus]|uniref:melanoma-associated antigen B3-like n=1 Tax=Cavia porcellus TaxID=10141 RepID=UPI00022B5E74